MQLVATLFRTTYSKLLVTAIIGLFLSGCGDPGPPQRAGGLPEVATVTLAAQSVALTTELPGRTSPYLMAQIRPQVNGLIEKRLFTEGARVDAGQVLYEIDAAPFQAALANATATLTAARKSYDRSGAALEAAQATLAQQEAALKLARINRGRLEDAFAERAVSESQRDQAATEAEMAEAALKAAQARVASERTAMAAAKAAIAQAEAALKTAHINLAYTRITAPVSGRIGRSSVTEGAIVTAYQPTPLATIQQLDPIYVDVPQSTSQLLQWKRKLQSGRLVGEKGSRNLVDLLLEDGTPYGVQGTLQFQDVTVDPTTGSVLLRMVFPNPEDILLPGMYVRTVIREGMVEKAVLAPQQGVTRDPRGNPVAWIVDATDTVVQRALTLDRAIGDQWLIASGLVAGDRLIVEGRQRIRPGAKVRAVDFEKNTPSANPAPDKRHD